MASDGSSDPTILIGLTDWQVLTTHNVGALIIRVRFWGVPYFNYGIIYPKPYSKYQGS